MSSRGRFEDLSTILFLIPFIVSGVYGLYLWVTSGISAILPTTVYLTVTRDPYVFMAGSFAVFIGLIVDLAGVEQGARQAKLQSDSGFIQKLAAASFILALIAAWYANGFVNVAGMGTDFMVGRFSLAFPALLLVLSYIILVPFKWGALKGSRVLGIISMLLVAPVLYEVGKRNALVGLAASAVLLLIGLLLFLRTEKKVETEAAA